MTRLFRTFAALGLLLALGSPAVAQSGCGGQFPASTVCANPGASTGLPGAVKLPFTLCAPPVSPADATAALQACLTRGGYIAIPTASYVITTQLVPVSNSTVALGGATVQQTTRGARVFYVPVRSNFEMIGGTLVGEGTFCGNPGQPVTAACPSGEWGDAGALTRNERGIELDNCTNCRLTKIHTKNNGTGGIVIWGGKNIFIDQPFIEGTNLYTTPVAAQANYQFGLYVLDSLTYGAVDGLVVNGAIVTGTAQGMLFTNEGVSTLNKSRQIIGTIARDIPGQHGLYAITGNLVVDGFSCNNVPDSCVKDQISIAGQDPYNFTATNVSADNIGGNMFEIAVLGSGVGLHNVKLQGIGRSVGRGLAASGPITNLSADIQVADSSLEPVFIAGNGPKDFDITLQSLRSAIDGVLVTATNADRIRFHHPVIRQPNTSNTGGVGFKVASASANVTIFNPVIADSGGLMVNGLINSTAGGTVKVIGSAAISGASGACVNAVGGTITLPLVSTVLSCGSSYGTPANISRGDIADVTVPVDNVYLKGNSAVNWGGIQVRGDGAGSLVFEGAPGVQFFFSGPVDPTPGISVPLGIVNRGFLQLVLQTTPGSGNSLVLAAAASGGASALTFPAGVTNFTATGGASQVVKQTSAGGAFTVARLACADLSDASSGCGSSAGITALTGDVTASGSGSVAATLATVNANVGTFGSATQAGQFTVNAKGLITAASNITVTPAVGSITGLGTGVAAALATNTGSSGAIVLFNGIGGTPSSITLTNGTALPISTGLSGAGTGVLAALAVNVATAGSFVVNGGALGTPSSGVATNLTGTAAGLTAGNVTTNANLTGAITSVGNATSLGSFSSANLLTALTDETGSGVAVFGTSPILSTVDARGTWTTGTSWTLPAHTLNGTVSGGGNQINNVIIGTSTPLAGTFTTLTATTINAYTLGGDITGAAFKLTTTGNTNALLTGLLVRNNNSGNAAGVLVQLQNDSAGAALFGVASTTYSTAIYQNRFFISASSANAGIIMDSGAATSPLIFAINNTEQARIQASGGLSIGTTTDPAVGGLQVNGQAFHPNATADTATLDSTACLATTGGKLLKGTGTLGICLGTSGRQFKTAFAPMLAGMDEISQLKLWNYRYRDGFGDAGARMQYGPTAQDVEAILPDLVRHDEAGNAINYDIGAFIPISLHALQQLNRRIIALEARK